MKHDAKNSIEQSSYIDTMTAARQNVPVADTKMIRSLCPAEIVPARNAIVLGRMAIRSSDGHDFTNDVNALASLDITTKPDHHRTSADVDWLFGVDAITDGWQDDIYNILFPLQPGEGIQSASLPAICDASGLVIKMPTLFIPLNWLDDHTPQLVPVLRWRVNMNARSDRRKMTIRLHYKFFSLNSLWGTYDVYKASEPTAKNPPNAL